MCSPSWPCGFYWIRRTYCAGVTPVPCCFRWPHSAGGGGVSTRPRYQIVWCIPTLCGPERVLVVSTEPPDDLSCLTTPGVGCPGGGGSFFVGFLGPTRQSTHPPPTAPRLVPSTLTLRRRRPFEPRRGWLGRRRPTTCTATPGRRG